MMKGHINQLINHLYEIKVRNISFHDIINNCVNQKAENNIYKKHRNSGKHLQLCQRNIHLHNQQRMVLRLALRLV